VMKEVPPDRLREIYFIWGMANKYQGNKGRAMSILKQTLELYPTYRDAFREYTMLLYEDNQMDTLQAVLRTWLVNNPKDEETRKAMQDLFKAPRTPASPAGH